MTVETVAPYTLPVVRRLITSHTPEGKGTIHRDEKVESYLSPIKGCRITPLWTTTESPAINSEQTLDGAGLAPDRMHIVSTNGSHIGAFDVAPGLEVPTHRTSTLDYIILVNGELTSVMEDGTESILTPGDIVIQRGTQHKWENRGTTWARFIAVLVDAKPVELVNKEGENVVLKEGWA
ncbi:hypothetical protein BS47DRAFT_1312092 [Hydnum rufescens UP504]|uniref:Cupin type-2 domain-containing protein n=1 Tax=Hydnum rufescens UP504 TaxID=1448309 RepID=A0A9P6E1P3_9AGAM|nr:hypothetical protein BS47DRAFT_1312092 [Hydnum rufescens UP504]